MNTKYKIITKTTYKDFCEKTDDIQIVENDSEMRRVTLIDKFGNKCQIDYKEDVSGAQFVIRNPNAATTCGCGSSFSA